MVRILALVGLGVCCLLLADDKPPQKVQVSKTEHMDFPAGGVLRLNNSVGELTVEGWDRPEVEITTVKSTREDYPSQEREKAVKELDRVHVETHRDGGELVITTDYPGGRFLSCLFGGTAGFDLEYRIKVPASTRFIADHGVGEVHVDNLRGDIQVAVHQGEITLDLPEQDRYAVDAKSNCGSVVSDFPGKEKSRFWFFGHRVENEDSSAPHKLNLKIGYGDIIVLKTQIPKMPAPVNPAQKQDGA
jgi:hypothetical protein